METFIYLFNYKLVQDLISEHCAPDFLQGSGFRNNRQTSSGIFIWSHHEKGNQKKFSKETP
ncbi:unknown [Methanothermobacter thermautotrophicus str. Delta H]|uniref:Uncharacterized protein n=1 Tax=Methanothermobacter thermautotrophicus (strain ATCC 29096 / DSM 1053 / JCM 10044 / NBRC 100330 / Delta H) TaxID=187420 RepID=O26291_METTH|nr:unknown [Methanothermobacter thermautotrophicus str. Delta H]